MKICRGLRGATTATENSAESILDATRELVKELIAENQIDADEVASAIFTMTPDLDAAFPARAARELGWAHVALLDAVAPRVPGDVRCCIRVLIHWNTERLPHELVHVYLRDARQLRPDLVSDKRGEP
jgi:chorismate mutase